VATLGTRTSPTGTSHRVKWRQDGTWQSETFGADHKAPALRFNHAVDLRGNRSPGGWIKGTSYRRELELSAVAVEGRPRELIE
jgi:hypothetical protein